MTDNCIFREKIIRTFHVDEKCKDYNNGPCKSLSPFMKEIVFQNDKYMYTKISLNPFCLLYDENESFKYKIKNLSRKEAEKLSNKLAKNNDMDLKEKIIHETPKKQLINILEGYEVESINIPKDGRISLPPKIKGLINEKHKKAILYYDEKLRDVFINFNINEINNVPDNFEKINNKFIRIDKKS